MNKLIISIFLPVLFIGNYWVCEWLYPNAGNDWNEFIPMDMLCHNFWSAIVLVSMVVSMLKTVYPITNFFILFTISLSLSDVLTRVLFGGYEFNAVGYCVTLLASLLISILAYKKISNVS